LICIQVQKDIMLNKDSNNKENKEDSSKRGVFLKAIISFILILMLIYPLNVLVASDYKSGEILKIWILTEDNFKISYIHSVELTEVEEYYEIKGKYIILKETTFRSYGAGLPSTTEYDFEQTKDGFRIYNIDKKLEELVYRTGAVRANHKLIINNKQYYFLDFSDPMEAIKFSPDRVSFLRYLTRRL